MKIATAVVNLTSTHTLHEERSKEESLRLWVGNERPVFAGEEEPAAAQVQISPEARTRQQQAAAQALVTGGAAADAPIEDSPEEDPRLKAMRLILEALTGRKIRITSFAPCSSESAGAAPLAQETNLAEQPPVRQGWGLEYDLLETVSEQEAMTFSATGQVVTADGQTIDFQLHLSMQREFVATNMVQIRAGDALLVDPLVINFSGKAVELSDMRFAFDLDADGMTEQIAGLAPGSGFLAFDRNQDGMINNGLELFGPATGQGFDELARLDSDGNGWLDENDPMYAELRIWMRDEAGNESLARLADKNVGAILLSPAKTAFALKDSGNTLQGQLRESSIFLGENGEVGMVQEIDLAV